MGSTNANRKTAGQIAPRSAFVIREVAQAYGPQNLQQQYHLLLTSGLTHLFVFIVLPSSHVQSQAASRPSKQRARGSEATTGELEF